MIQKLRNSTGGITSQGVKNELLIRCIMQKIRREIAIYKANILTYQRNSVGIGEHPDIVEAIELQVAKLAEAER